MGRYTIIIEMTCDSAAVEMPLQWRTATSLVSLNEASFAEELL